MQKKIIAAIAIAITVAGIVLGSLIYLQKRNVAPTGSIVTQTPKKTVATAELETGEENKVETQPVGNASGITDQIAVQLQTEEEKFSAEDAEAETLNINQEDLDNFGESYDENEF